MAPAAATITVSLSDRRPIKISKTAWPLIASSSWFDGEHECQANEVAWIRVRSHADGRTIVYGDRDRGPGGMAIGYRGAYAGYLLIPQTDAPETMVEGPAGPDGPLVTHRDVDPSEIVRAIRRVAAAIDHDELGSECVADLPAEVL